MASIFRVEQRNSVSLPCKWCSIFLQNVGTYLPNYTTSRSTRKQSTECDNRSSWKHYEQSRLLKLRVHKQYQNISSWMDNVLPSSHYILL